MTRGIYLPSFVVIGGVVLTLSCREAVTLGQGHRKAIQYMSPDLYFLCPKYLRSSSNDFDMRSKSRCSGGGCGRNELKTQSHPRLGRLNYMQHTLQCWWSFKLNMKRICPKMCSITCHAFCAKIWRTVDIREWYEEVCNICGGFFCVCVCGGDLVKSRSHEIGCHYDRFALKFDRHLGSAAAEVPVKF